MSGEVEFHWRVDGHAGDGAYFLPEISHPRSRLTTRPPLRKMMCTGMGILYANAALFKDETKKKSTTCTT